MGLPQCSQLIPFGSGLGLLLLPSGLMGTKRPLRFLNISFKKCSCFIAQPFQPYVVRKHRLRLRALELFWLYVHR